jgi:DNA-binding NtrC family response regulator
MEHRILVVDDNADNLAATELLLHDNGYLVDAVRNAADAIEKVRSDNNGYSLVILDYHLPDKTGADALAALRTINPNLYVLVYSGDTKSRDPVMATLRGGAVDFIEKSEDPRYLLDIVQQWCSKFDETTRLLIAPASLSENETLVRSFGIAGRSQSLADLCRAIQKYGREEAGANVLLLGETGTGKEVIARAIHRNSPRQKGPFVAINCGAIPENLIESELFGHDRGAFTGAHMRKEGKFENANRGTLFLDEIGEATLATQVRLLRVLQEKVVTPLGSNREVKVDVRIIAATNRDLLSEIKAGRFREDLYYRLNIISMCIPPLRERREDIAPLVMHFCNQFNREKNKKKNFLMRTVRLMEGYSWPGNVRELENYVTKLLTQGNSDTITPECLDAKFFSATPLQTLTLPDLISRQEKERLDFISENLKSSKSMRDAAKKMGVSKSTLHHMLKKFGVIRGDAAKEVPSAR